MLIFVEKEYIIVLYILGRVDNVKKIFTSVDIGSDSVKILVSELFDGKLNVLSSNSIKSKGIRKGLVVDSNLAINTIKDGMKVKMHVWVYITTKWVHSQENHRLYMTEQTLPLQRLN